MMIKINYEVDIMQVDSFVFFLHSYHTRYGNLITFCCNAPQLHFYQLRKYVVTEPIN